MITNKTEVAIMEALSKMEYPEKTIPSVLAIIEILKSSNEPAVLHKAIASVLNTLSCGDDEEAMKEKLRYMISGIQ